MTPPPPIACEVPGCTFSTEDGIPSHELRIGKYPERKVREKSCPAFDRVCDRSKHKGHFKRICERASVKGVEGKKASDSSSSSGESSEEGERGSVATSTTRQGLEMAISTTKQGPEIAEHGEMAEHSEMA